MKKIKKVRLRLNRPKGHRKYLVVSETCMELVNIKPIDHNYCARNRHQSVTPSKVKPYIVCTPKNIKRHITPQSSVRKCKRQLIETPEFETPREQANDKEHVQCNSDVFDEISDDYKEFVTPSKVKPYVVCTPKNIKRHITPQSSVRKSRQQLIEPHEFETSREQANDKEHVQSNSVVFDEISDHYKEVVTPSKVKPYVVCTPKNIKRHLTPQSSVKKQNKRRLTELCESEPTRERIYEKDHMQSKDYKEFIEMASDKEVLDKLFEFKLLHYFRLFFSLLKQGKYPLKNIALLLWLETVKWYSCITLREMRFWKTTKNFWRAGYRLFHGKFISFMSGPRSIGYFRSGHMPERTLEPGLSQINFAIPSRAQLLSDSMETGIPKVLKPGVITQVFQSIKNSKVSKINMMCMDGKKVTVGLDSKFGDVDMFGHEQSPTLAEQAERLSREESLVDEIRDTVNDQLLELVSNPVNDTESKMGIKAKETVDMLFALVYVLTVRLKEGRLLKKKQEYGLMKLKEKAGPDWHTSKFVFAISSVQAFLYRVKVFIKRTLTNIDSLCHIGSQLNGTNTYVRDNVIQCSQRNLFNLKPYPAQSQPVPSQFVPQRTPEWHLIRKQAPVTGSTLHNALGLRTLALQKKHFDVKILGIEEQEPSEEVKKYFEHGTTNERNAIATLAGKFLPMFLPNLAYVEEGCYFIYSCLNKEKPVLAVSPDGSLREFDTADNSDNNAFVRDCKAAIEIKCPFPKKNDITIYYSLPQYYVCQCLAEMKALEVKSMIFVCYTAESATFFEVDYQEELWQLLQEECEDLYSTESPKRPVKKRSTTNIIQQKLKDFSENNVRLLVELPSICMSNLAIASSISEIESPYLKQPKVQTMGIERGLEKPFMDLLGALSESLDCIKTGHQLSRKKAAEVMVWVLSNKDRYWSPELPNSLIVAYGMKDYRLTSE